MENGDRESIIDKVQAMLAKTEARGASEAEAATALAMTQRLLAQHNLTMAEVEDVKADGSPVGEGRIKNTTVWQVQLAAQMAPAFFVRIVQLGQVICFIGRPDNVRVAQEMYCWVEPQVVRIPREAALARGMYLKGSMRWIRSFRLGLIVRLGARLEEEMRKAAAAEVKMRAVVVRVESENAEYIAQQFPNATEEDQLEAKDHLAFWTGHAAGESVSLEPQSRQVKGG